MLLCYGGAIYVNDDHIKFDKNGGVKTYFYNCASQNSDGGVFYINDCVIERCWADDYGGAIYVNGDHCNIVDCEFYKCSVTNNTGSAIYDDNNYCALTNCVLIGNSSDSNACYFNYDVVATDFIFLNKFNFHTEGKQLTLIRCEVDNEGTRAYTINLGRGTLMSTNASLTILFGILAGAFLISTATFMYLYLKLRKLETK